MSSDLYTFEFMVLMEHQEIPGKQLNLSQKRNTLWQQIWESSAYRSQACKKSCQQMRSKGRKNRMKVEEPLWEYQYLRGGQRRKNEQRL